MPERIDLLKARGIYREGFEKRAEAFDQLLARASLGNLQTQEINGYTPFEVQVLPLVMAIAASPDLLDLSHCPHRAVSASLLLPLGKIIDAGVQDNILDYARKRFHLATICDGPEQSYLILHGTNNWFEAIGELGERKIHFCKTQVGSPDQVERENLRHLPRGFSLNDISQVDLACIKRLNGVDCRIVHAEKSVITMANELIEKFNLSNPTKAVLACTWVPCLNCVHLITDSRKSLNLEVISLYSAEGDKEDEQMARKIREELQTEHLGIFSGPYVSVPKIPGYGWLPQKKEFIEQINGSLGLSRDKRVRLLADAFRLI